MTGGGARAAYQVGVVRAIYEIVGKKSGLFDVVTGNSAGALNATYLAGHAENWDIATHNLGELWKKLRPQNVYDLRAFKITDLGAKWFGGALFGGLSSKGGSFNNLLDTTPLLELIQREVDFDDISKCVMKGLLHGFGLSTTNYNSGSSVVFYEGHETIQDWARSDRFSVRTKFHARHVLASSAIPIFFPPVQIGSSYFGDGCIRQTTPLSPAIHLGAEKLVAIGIRYPRQQSRVHDLSFSPIPNPSIGQVMGVLLNAIFLDSLEGDVERLQRINTLVEDHPKTDFKKIPILMIRPSMDLGTMSQMKSESLPPMLRYLLKGLGVSDDKGLDLLSYLAFDESYTRPLIDLGYEDAMKRKDEIRTFFEV